MKYVSLPADGEEQTSLLAVSTEDGRVIFYSTEKLQEATEEDSTISDATPVAQIGGKQIGLPGRIKDFEVLSLAEQAKDIRDGFLVVTGNSDGTVRIWKISGGDLVSGKESKSSKDTKHTTRQIGKVLSVYETGNRITCLASFIMLPAENPSTLFDEEDDDEDEDEPEESSSDDSDDE